MYSYLHSHVPSGVTGVRPIQSKIVTELLFIIVSVHTYMYAMADTHIVTMYVCMYNVDFIQQSN